MFVPSELRRAYSDKEAAGTVVPRRSRSLARAVADPSPISTTTKVPSSRAELRPRAAAKVANIDCPPAEAAPRSPDGERARPGAARFHLTSTLTEDRFA